MIHVLFDIDETLLSVPKNINDKTSSAMFKKVFGVEAHEEMINNVGKTEEGIIKEILEKVGYKSASTEQEQAFFEVPEEAYKVWAQTTAQELKLHPVRILPGVEELLKALSKNLSVKLGLLTGNNPYRAEEKLKAAKLDSYFRDSNGKLIGAFGDIADKREKLFDIVKRQATDGDKFIIVDDSLIGAKMAQTHEIPMIMVATGKATENELRSFTPNVFSDFGENRWQEAVSIIEKL